MNVITLRSTDKDNRPTVKVGASGGFMTQAGLKIKFINFDCSEMTGAGFLTLSGEPSETISIKSLGYDKDEANQDGYIINKPVIIQECNIKNLQNSLLYGNKKPWTLRDFRITDCIVQMNNAGSNGVINLYGATGTIKDMTIKNSTFYNLVKIVLLILFVIKITHNLGNILARVIILQLTLYPIIHSVRLFQIKTLAIIYLMIRPQ